MEYRLNKKTLLARLSEWNTFLKRKVSLIACGGTALTLLDVKPSTKDVDFMVPLERDYKYLTKILRDLGYRSGSGYGWVKKDEVYLFDLFPGKRIHTTELLESPLEEDCHIPLEGFSHLYIGILNYYDLITSKIFRGTAVDFEDCLLLVEARRDDIDTKRLDEHCRQLASYDVSEQRILGNLEHFFSLLDERGLL